MRRRLIAGLILALAVGGLVWWLLPPLLIFLAWRFNYYYEGLIAGWCFDLLYGVPGAAWWGLPFLGTLAALILVLAVEITKKYVYVATIT